MKTVGFALSMVSTTLSLIVLALYSLERRARLAAEDRLATATAWAHLPIFISELAAHRLPDPLAAWRQPGIWPAPAPDERAPDFVWAASGVRPASVAPNAVLWETDTETFWQYDDGAWIAIEHDPIHMEDHYNGDRSTP